ncbi:outer membrane protein assembly factor BamA [Halocola ammonii]
MRQLLVALLISFIIPFTSICQIDGPAQIGGTELDYSNPQTYTIAGISVLGAEHTDVQAIKLFTGLQVGDEIQVPGDAISKAIKNLWEQKLFADISIRIAEIRGEDIFLLIELEEMPRLGGFSFRGVSKSGADNLRDEIKLVRGIVVNDNLITTTKNAIRQYYIGKGYYNADIEIETKDASALDNHVDLIIKVDKKSRVRIDEINFIGVEKVNERKLSKAMKDTKEKAIWRVFNPSRFKPKKYKADKEKLISYYNSQGYRNAKILEDSVYWVDNKNLGIDIKIHEGDKFYFRDISFIGNTKYSSDTLEQLLGIEPGDVYNSEELNQRLFMNPQGMDISSLYMDQGYLTFQAIPVETLIENDSIDLEIRVQEGKQFRVGKVTVVGNTKTNDHVIYREIRTNPGDLFSRTDIIRTQRELNNLGYFNPEAFNVTPMQNPEDGTVDIEYVVEEKPSDQIQLSGGFGANRIVGTLGISFTNFSMRNIFNKEAWRPLPTGDGQKLSLNAVSNGRFYQSYSASFTEPWVGGKKPNSLSFSLSHSVQNLSSIGELERSVKITGGSVGYGKRLQWPDDYFILQLTGSYQHFNLNNFSSVFSFANGTSNNLAAQVTLQRNSINEPIFPTRGSNIKFTTKFTPPYSAFDGRDDYSGLSEQERFEWVEYHKWKFTADWYTSLTPEKKERQLVLKTSAGFGFLGYYNEQLGLSPFERFYLGGVFLSGFILDGREIINLRGYEDLSLSPTTGAPFIAKYSAELRYPISTNPQATIYTLAFLEAGQTWQDFEDYDPFNLKRSGGVGLRIFLPMFGLLGLDYGWRFDDVPSQPDMQRGILHFSIGMNIGEL